MKNLNLDGISLVFDLDGTLVDTAPDLIATLNHVLESIDCAPVDEEFMRPIISFGARRMIVEGLAAAKLDMSEDETDALFQKFLVHYAENVAANSRPFANVKSVLEEASQAGATLGVCTNKREDLSISLLRQLDMLDLFCTIVGRDTLDVCKPHPRHLTETIARMDGDPARAIMVGDSPTDVKTAKNANVPVVAVTFGYSEIAPHDLGADAVIDDYAQLCEALTNLIDG